MLWIDVIITFLWLRGKIIPTRLFTNIFQVVIWLKKKKKDSPQKKVTVPNWHGAVRII